MKRDLAVYILVFLCGAWSRTMAGKKETQYTNTWIAEIHGGEEVAQRVARDLGYTYKSPAEPFEDHYVFIREDHPEVSKRSSHHLTSNLLDVDEVKWAEQQAIVERSKRGYVPIIPKAQEYHERLTQEEAAKLAAEFDSLLTNTDSTNYNSGYGSSNYGGSRTSNSGFGSPGLGGSRLSSFGFGGTGFGGSSGSGFDSVGGDNTQSENAVFVTVGSLDTEDTIVNKVMSKLGTNNVGALVFCTEAISPSTGKQISYTLARNGKISGGGVTMARIRGTVTTTSINKMVKDLEKDGTIRAGKVAVVFTKSDSGSVNKESNQAETNVASNVFGNSATNGASKDGKIVYVSVRSGDSQSAIANSIIKALGTKKLGLLIISGNVLSMRDRNIVVSKIGQSGKVGGGGVSSMIIGTSSGTAFSRTVKSAVSQYEAMGVVGGDNLAVVLREGEGSSGTNQGLPAGNGDSGNFYSGGLGGLASGGNKVAKTGGNGNSDSLDLGALGGLEDGGNSVADTDYGGLSALLGGGNEVTNTGNKPVSNSGSSGATETSRPTSTGGGSTVSKILAVRMDQVTDVAGYINDNLGNKLVGAIIVSGSLVDQKYVNDLYEKLSMYDKLGGDNGQITIMSTSDEKGNPVNARGVFQSVNNLMTGGKIRPGEVPVVLTTGDYLDMDSLNEMMEKADQGDLSKLGTFPTQPTDGKAMLATYKGVTKHIGCLSNKQSAYKSRFNDPFWPKQWYMQDYRTKDGPVMDHNIIPVYDMGYTGEGIYVAVVDDGVQTHRDLAGQLVSSLSYDFCDDKPGCEPSPPTKKDKNSHGTKCAGEIAMVANNEVCGVGVAYNVKIGGIKTLGTQTIEYAEAKGLVYKLDKFDIYSCSWGPKDDAMTLGRVGHMTDISFKDGTKKGRKGKGTIYVFSAGNGKRDGDNCGLDGMSNHIATISITGVSQLGKTVDYSERCTAVFAGAYSGGNYGDEAVVTTDLNNDCTTTFSGTSAAAPIATGIIALVLSANPDLTYRDVMHLIAMSSEVAPVANNEGIWYKNGAGFWVSNDFGFGLMNAENMVLLAKKWKNVPAKNTCVVAVNLQSPHAFTVGDDAVIKFNTQACQDKDKDTVYYLEQIQLSSTIQYPYRGAISIKITSPAGTVSDILEKRLKDSDTDGLNEWSIKSVHNWGENPKGTWKIEVKANHVPEVSSATGYVDGFTLLLHGTVQKPYDTPRKYAAFRLPNGKTSEA